jgi:TetR/AcrR family tetracycline transcriptional repressor
VPAKTAPPGAARRPDRPRGRTRRRGPGERAGLAREVVLEAARAISSREGLARLTMRRLAARLGVAPNALYSHFADKSALVEALADAVLGGVPLPPPGDPDWRAGLVHLMSESRRLLLAHAELIPVFLSRASRGPNALRLGEATLGLLARAGLEGAPAVQALQVLLVYTIGFAAHEAPRRADPDPQRRRALGEAAARSARGLPRVRLAAAELAHHPDDATFTIGLGWVIAGIADATRPR